MADELGHRRVELLAGALVVIDHVAGVVKHLGDVFAQVGSQVQAVDGVLGGTVGRCQVEQSISREHLEAWILAYCVGQIAGDHVTLTSIISDPNADPHEYESSTRDMAAIARARLVIINGMGYDGFMPKLLRATPNPAREVMDVSKLAGKKEGDNWHIWYDPTVMPKFARAVTDFFVRIDAANARSYQNWLLLFETSYKPFTNKVAAMRAPEKIIGSAPGNSTRRKMLQRVPRSVRIMRMSSGSVARSPSTALTTMGKTGR